MSAPRSAGRRKQRERERIGRDNGQRVRRVQSQLYDVSIVANRTG